MSHGEGERVEGIVKRYYYYLRDQPVNNNDNDFLGRPLVTVCLLKDSTNRFHRGISICSDRDIPCKIRGRGFAYSRALKAYSSGVSSEPVQREEAESVLDVVLDKEQIPVTENYVIKSEYDVNLTSFEKKLAKIKT